MSKFETKVTDGKIRLNGILTDLTPAEAKELAEALTKAAKDAEVEFVAGGVYKDQDGVIYVGDGAVRYASPGLKLWNTTKGTYCDAEWWQHRGGIHSSHLSPVTTATGEPLVVNLPR